MNAVLDCSSPQKIRLIGQLDFDTVPSLNNRFLPLLEDNDFLTLDLTGVSYSNSAGLSLLLHWVKLAKLKKKNLSIQGIPEQMQRIARLTSVSSFLGI